MSIHVHSFRHFRATFEYHRTKDILHVQKMLGHRSIDSTMVYTQLVDWDDPTQFTCKVVKTAEEAVSLIEVGWDKVDEFDGVKLYKKRK